MRQIFRQELQQVGDDLILMAEHVATAIDKATTALKSADIALAEQVIEADRRIDELERHLDEQCVSLLARQAPVATDLRVVVSALRLSATIERMGDLARHVAYVARGRYPEKALTGEIRSVIDQMGTAAANVGRQVVELLKTHDLSLASTIEADDEILDNLHRQTFPLILDEAQDATRQQVIDSVLLSRYLERFGDHGVSVCRRIVYLVTGDPDAAARSTDDEHTVR